MKPRLLFVSLAIALSTVQSQVFQFIGPIGPFGLDVIDLQVPSGATFLLCDGIHVLTALISLKNEFLLGWSEVHRRFRFCFDLGLLLNHFLGDIFKDLIPAAIWPGRTHQILPEYMGFEEEIRLYSTTMLTWK